MEDINKILKIMNKVNEDLDEHQSYYEETKKNYKKVRRGSGKTICYYNEKELRKVYKAMKDDNFYGIKGVGLNE